MTFTIDTIDYVTRIGNSSRAPIELIQKSVATPCLDCAFFLLKMIGELGG